MSMEKKQTAPADRGHAVGVIVFVLGVGTLLPWNFFITASQYFNGRLRAPNNTSNATLEGATKDYKYDSWMALLSQLPLLLFTLLNSFLHQRVKERFRVAFSLVLIFLLFSLTAGLVQVAMEPDTFFSVTMATIWFINMCGAVLQGSLFGVVGLFPLQYSTLFMSGQGLAGIFAALAMLFSILSNADENSAALGYFITPCVATLMTLLCYLLLPHLKFADFYLNKRQSERVEVMQTLLSSTEKKPLNQTAKDLEASGTVPDTDQNQDRSSVFAVFKKIWRMAAVCDLGVRRHSVGVSCDHGPSSERLHGQRSVEKSLHLCLLFHRLQRHGPGGTRHPVSRPMALAGERSVSRGGGVSSGFHPSADAV
uniref:Solute carrier family 29 member 2 n=1 Tax=Labrus bergylta TaxID=56723 RepID=A0A3Q3GZH2_9LABR